MADDFSVATTSHRAKFKVKGWGRKHALSAMRVCENVCHHSTAREQRTGTNHSIDHSLLSITVIHILPTYVRSQPNTPQISFYDAIRLER